MAKVKDGVALMPIIALVGGIAGPAVGYGIIQNKVTNLEAQIAKLDDEIERSKSILHQRISTTQSEISELKTSALMRVTDVEVKITKLDSKIDIYSREAQAAASSAQETMNAILTRLQRDMR